MRPAITSPSGPVTRLQSFRDDLRALSFSLMNEAVHSNGARRAFKLTSVTVAGGSVAYVHDRDSLLVLLPRPLQKHESTVLETIAEGEILERPEGDTYWRLGDDAWYPRPFVGGIERATFRISVETNAPFVPFAPGEILTRETGKIVTRLNGPMEAAYVIAGRYSTFIEEADGFRVHVSNYAAARKEEAVRIARIVHGVRGMPHRLARRSLPIQGSADPRDHRSGLGTGAAGLHFRDAGSLSDARPRLHAR